MTTRMISGLFLLCAVLLLSGCEKEKGVGKYGMMDENTPEYTALRFAQSIYDDPDITVALTLSTDRMQRLLQNYRTNRNVQRHVMNLKYDSVEIKPDGGNKIGRTQFSESSTITLFFTGTYNNDKIEDLRTLELIRESGQWRVDQVTSQYM